LHGVEHQPTERFIHDMTRDRLADRPGVLDAFTLADIRRCQASVALVIAKRHPSAADAANDQSLQQRGAFAGRAPTTISAVTLGVLKQALLVRLVL
jgi:hypothetical protein